MSKTLKNLIFLISILYAVSIEPKFLEKEQNFKPFVSVPLISKPQLEEIPMYSFAEEKRIGKAIKCLYLDNYDIYDISGLGASNDDGRHTKQLNIINENGTKTTCDIYFNFCYNLKKQSPYNVEDKQAFIKLGEEVKVLGGNLKNGNKWSILNETNGSNKTYIQIEVNSENNNSLIYNLKCREEMKDNRKDVPFRIVDNETSATYIPNISNGYKVILTVESYYACKRYSFYFIFEFIEKNKVIFGIILMVFGLFNCLLGNRFARVTSLILCIFTVTILVLIFSQYILPSGCAEWIIIVMLVVGLILGTVAGIFAFRHHKTVIALLVGGISGFFLGQFLYSLFGNRIPVNGTVMNIVFVLVSIGVLIAIAIKFKKEIVIIGTSFIGAYCFIRGISLIAGHFPDEFKIADLVTSGENEQIAELLTWHVYVYLTFIVIITVLSVIFQFKFNKEKGEEELKSSEK